MRLFSKQARQAGRVRQGSNRGATMGFQKFLVINACYIGLDLVDMFGLAMSIVSFHFNQST